MAKATKPRVMLLILPALLWLLICGRAPARDCADGMGGSGFSSPGEYNGDDCSNAPPLSITGPDGADGGLSVPGEYLYTASGGLSPYSWSTDGTQRQTGISINQNGLVRLQSEACGSFIVTVTESCGNSAFMSVATNVGEWIETARCDYDDPDPEGSVGCSMVSSTKYSYDSFVIRWIHAPTNWISPCGGPSCSEPCGLEEYSCPECCAPEYHLGHYEQEWRCPSP